MIAPKLLTRTLEEMGLMTASQIEQTLATQRRQGKRLGRLLVEAGLLRSEQVGFSLAAQLGILPATGALPMDEELEATISVAAAQEHRIVPLALEQGRLWLATDQLFNALAVDCLSSLAQWPVELVFVTPERLTQLLTKRYAASAPTAPAGVLPTVAAAAARGEAADIGVEAAVALRGSDAARSGAAAEGDDAPIVRLVDQLFEEAYRQRASDIHIEPLAAQLRVRLRIDGVLREVPPPPQRLHGSITSRLKILAGMDIAEKRLPQDGRIQRQVEGRPLDVRVSSLPALHGETIVMRLLDKASVLIGVEELGLSGVALERFRRVIALPYGMMLVTGPTGSGKTTTLYAALGTLNTPKKKLITVEDPVEYQIPGINQVQVRPQVGLTFAQGLRAMLRQAPDVIMVGEIRDAETAQVAVQAALTGHLVFSTLHTNDAPSAVTRLVDMGVPPYLVASTVQAVLAQRLLRRVCDGCRATYEPGLEELAPFADLEASAPGPVPVARAFARGAGCAQCGGTGFRGRVGVFELLTMGEELRELVHARAASEVIRARATVLGMQTLRGDGWEKAERGITTLAEVLRVTGDLE